MCEFFTFLDAFCLIWALAHEIFYRNIKYIMLMQLILMGGNAKYTERCVKQIFVEYSCNNETYGRNAVTDPCAVFRFGRMDGARVTETSAHTGLMRMFLDGRKLRCLLRFVHIKRYISASYSAPYIWQRAVVIRSTRNVIAHVR